MIIILHENEKVISVEKKDKTNNVFLESFVDTRISNSFF